jgi:nucleoside-diphosphate-sugar epimerase
MNHRTVLVTGAAGFIGPKVVQLLLTQGYRVIVLDKLTLTEIR